MRFQFQRFLNHWYRQPNHAIWLTQQEKLLAEAVDEIFGFYLVQLGAPWPRDLLSHSRVSHRIIVDRRPVHLDGMMPVAADFRYLPFRRESVDVVVLPHTLESVEDPYQLLRQVDRTLVLDGHLIVTGFNPANPGNWRARYFGRGRKAFSQGNWIRMHRVIDWLNVLGYDIKLAQHLPLGRGLTGGQARNWRQWLEKLEFGLEKASMHLGRTYCIVAQKRSAPLTPAGLNWKLANWLPVNKGAWVPSRRVYRQQAKNGKKAHNLHEEG